MPIDRLITSQPITISNSHTNSCLWSFGQLANASDFYDETRGFNLQMIFNLTDNTNL